MKQLFFILTILVISVGNAFSQIIITSTDTTRLYSDTLLLNVASFRGAVQWQYSADSVQWSYLSGEENDTLVFYSFETAGFYRAQIYEGTCNPVYSETIKVDFALPELSILIPDSISPTSVLLKGEISDNGGCEISSQGFYWSGTNSTPTADDNVIYAGTDNNFFSAELSGLQPETTYYIIAFATNCKGTTCSAIQFTTGEETDSGVFTDARDGREYKWKKIGDQIWMVENLAYNVGDGCWAYNNNEDYVETYGRLYTFDAAQAACPDGWHVPSDEEIKQLEMFLGMTQAEADMTNTWRGTGVGTSLITGGDSGFEALLSGRRSPSGFSLMGRMEYTWTSTPFGGYGWRRCLDKYQNTVGRWNTFPKSYGFSVRCVKD